MKKILIGASVAVLLLNSSIHIGVTYLRYIRTLGLGFAPGISLVRTVTPIVPKDLRVKL